MAKKLDRSTVSFGSWFLTVFLVAIPCVGFITILLGAFFSNNESRRNFYRAHLAWIGLVVVLYGSLFLIGIAPDVRQMLRDYQKEHSQSATSKKPTVKKAITE